MPAKRQRTSTRRRGQTLEVEERARIMDGYLAIFRETANMMLACRQVGVDRQSVYRWCRDDIDGFASRYVDAEQDYKDRLRAEIHRRAILGIEKPITVAGKREVIREYDTTLLIFETKRWMPEYRDRWEGDAPMPAWAQVQASANANAFVFVLNGEQKPADAMNEGELAAAEQALLVERAKLEVGGGANDVP